MLDFFENVNYTLHISKTQFTQKPDGGNFHDRIKRNIQGIIKKSNRR